MSDRKRPATMEELEKAAAERAAAEKAEAVAKEKEKASAAESTPETVLAPVPEKPKKLPFWVAPDEATQAEWAAQRAERLAQRRAERRAAKEKEDEERRVKAAEEEAIAAGRDPKEPRRPKGKGRPLRFVKKLNKDTPYIAHNIKPPKSPPLPKLKVEEEKKEEKKEEPAEKKRKGPPPPLDLTKQPAEKEEPFPESPPTRSPRLRLDDKDAVTLHHVLSTVNESLRVEMKKHEDVNLALAQDIQGPLRVLGDLGRLVRILFVSMEQHREKIWQEKKAALRSEEPESPPVRVKWRGQLAAFSKPIQYYTLPIRQVSDDDNEHEDGDGKKPQNGDSKDNENNNGENIEYDEDSLFSLLEPGIPGYSEDDSDFSDYPISAVVWEAFRKSDRRRALIAKAKKAAKRDYDTVFEDSDSDSDLEPVTELHDKKLMEYAMIRSPSLPPKYESDPLDPLDPRRHEAYVIQEMRRDEVLAEKRDRYEARAARRKARAEALAKADALRAQYEAEINKIRQEALKVATAAVKKQLDDLEDERDAALHLARTAVHDRDTIEDVLGDREGEMDQLRTMLREFIERLPGDEDDDEEGEEEADDGDDTSDDEVNHTEENETGFEDKAEAFKAGGEEGVKDTPVDSDNNTSDDKMPEDKYSDNDEQEHVSAETDQVPEVPPDDDSSPLRPLSPYPPEEEMEEDIPDVPPTPSTPMASWDRERLVNEAERILRTTMPPPTPVDRQFNQRPPPPSPGPERSSSRFGSTTYTVRKGRALLGPGFFSCLLDVVLSVLLLVYQQKANIETVAKWMMYVFIMPTFLALKTLVLRLPRKIKAWTKSRRQPQSSSQPVGLADIIKEQALDTRPVSTPPPEMSFALLRHPASRRELAIAYRHHVRQMYHLFPRDAIAELAISLMVLFSMFLLISAVRERNLWLDANNTAEAPMEYLQTLALQAQSQYAEAGMCSPASQAVVGPQLCMCIPTYYDTHFVLESAGYNLLFVRDAAQDYYQLISMWLAWGWHSAIPWSWMEDVVQWRKGDQIHSRG